jgi:hypothetical protein
MQSHGFHRRGLLIAAVLAGAVASIATSPPFWTQFEFVEGPAITLAPTLPEREYAITLRVTANQLDNASGRLDVRGTLRSPASALVVLAVVTDTVGADGPGFEDIIELRPETPHSLRFALDPVFAGCSEPVCEGRVRLLIRAEQLSEPVTLEWTLEAMVEADLPEPEPDSLWIDVIIEEL